MPMRRGGVGWLYTVPAIGRECSGNLLKIHG